MIKTTSTRRKLRETVVMANKADLNKLTSCAFLLLSTIFLKIANYKVSCGTTKYSRSNVF